MFPRLTSRVAAMRAVSALLTEAELIARGRGAGHPAAEHLVLAALRLPDGTAARALERVGASAADVEAALDAQEADDLERVGVHVHTAGITAELPPPGEPGGVHRSEPSAQELFRAAGADARRSGGRLVGAHVLRAAADLEHGPTARALRRAGVDRTALRGAATAEIDAGARG